MSKTQIDQVQRPLNQENSAQINYVPLSDKELMVDHIKDSLLKQDTSSQQPRLNQNRVNQDLSNDETSERLSSFQMDCFHSVSRVDEKTIADSSIESLIMYVIMMLEEDLQESQRLSEQSLKNLRILEKKCMDEAKDKHGDWLYSSAIANTIGATVPIMLSGRGWDPTAAGLVGKGINSAGSVTDGWRQQGISISQMKKQQASKVTDQERSDNQQIMKRLQDLKSFLEQVLQLRLQAARNN